MARGGYRPGAGRKPGSKNKRTLARELIARTALEAGVTPLEVMLQTMRKLWKEGDAKGACAIATDAAPYVHPRLSAVDARIDEAGKYEAKPVPVEERDSDLPRLVPAEAVSPSQH